MYIKSTTHENGNREFYLMDFDTLDDYDRLLKIMKEDYQMEVKEEFTGLFTFRTTLELEGFQYEFIWDEDLGNYIYSKSQDEKAILRLEQVLKEAEDKINQISKETNEGMAPEKTENTILITLIDESNETYFDNFIPDYYKKDDNMIYLGILMEHIAIGSLLFQQVEDTLYIHWIYISPKYRRFHYASQSVEELISKMKDLGASTMVALMDAAGEGIDIAAEFFLYNGFAEHIKYYDIYRMQIEEFCQQPQMVKLMEKKLSGHVVPLSLAEELPLKHWNSRYFKIDKSPEYEEFSFVYMNQGEILGVLLGKQESNSEFLLETLFSAGEDPLHLLDLILKFVHTVKEKGDEKSVIKIIAIDLKMEQLVQKMFGIEKASGQIASYTYSYNL